MVALWSLFGHLRLHNPDIDAEGIEFGRHAGGDSAVGDDAVEFPGVGYMHETALVELRRVEHRNHLFSLLDHHLVEQCLLEVGRRNAMLDGELVHSEEELVSAEVPEHRQCNRPDHRMAVHAHIAA